MWATKFFLINTQEPVFYSKNKNEQKSAGYLRRFFLVISLLPYLMSKGNSMCLNVRYTFFWVFIILFYNNSATYYNSSLIQFENEDRLSYKRGKKSHSQFFFFKKKKPFHQCCIRKTNFIDMWWPKNLQLYKTCIYILIHNSIIIFKNMVKFSYSPLISAETYVFPFNYVSIALWIW